MRNIFDQYSQPENRLTHALASTLSADRSLLRPFLRWAGAKGIPPLRELRITEQQVPGQVAAGEEAEGRGLPDACVFAEPGWALLIEAKIQAEVDPGQLERHVKTARRHGFDAPHLLLLSVDPPGWRLPDHITWRPWRDLYRWLRGRADASSFASVLAEYLEVFEARMVTENYSIRGTLTMFDGLKFDADAPYTYAEGKRLIRLLGDALQKRRDLERLGVDPVGARRSAITGSAGTGVWDFLPLEVARGAASFTAHPHLTLGLNQTMAVAGITVPNDVRGGFRSRLRELGQEGFFDCLRTVERRLRTVIRRSKGSQVAVYAVQRHFRSQRSLGEEDARLEADLRTLVPGGRGRTKYQPEWVRAIYEVLCKKRSNIQMGVDVRFSYGCPIVRSPGAGDLFAASWIAMSPVLDLAMGD